MSKLKEFVFNKVMSIFIFNISKKKKQKRKEKISNQLSVRHQILCKRPDSYLY